MGEKRGKYNTNGRARNKPFSVKFTEDELKRVNEKLDRIEGKSKSDKILKLILNKTWDKIKL